LGTGKREQKSFVDARRVDTFERWETGKEQDRTEADVTRRQPATELSVPKTHKVGERGQNRRGGVGGGPKVREKGGSSNSPLIKIIRFGRRGGKRKKKKAQSLDQRGVLPKERNLKGPPRPLCHTLSEKRRKGGVGTR